MFTPTLSFNGIVIADYKVCDPSGLCDTATLTINVGGANNPPVALNDTTTTNEDVTVVGTVATNDTDIDNIATDLTYTVVSIVPVTQGMISIDTNGVYSFIPALNFNGTVNINYKVCDLEGLCDTAILTVIVNPVNDAPQAINDAIVTSENIPTNGTVAANDTDIDNLSTELTYSTITSVGASEGVFVLNTDGTYTFTPATDFNGVVNVSYKVCDPSGLCDTAVLTITVNALNNAPVATNSTNTILEDTPVNGTLVSNVSDVDNTIGSLTFTSVTNVPITEGVLNINPDGTYTFTPSNNFNGIVNVDYKVCDPSGLCDTATLTITVTPVNDAPQANNNSTITPEDTPVSGTVSTGVTDIDDVLNTLVFTPISSVPVEQGVLVFNNDGTYTFTPSNNFNGIVTVDFKVCDPSGACDTATLTVTVLPLNDAPIANNSTNTTPEDTPVSGTLATSVSDTDSPTGSLTFTLITGVPASQGNFVLNSDVLIHTILRLLLISMDWLQLLIRYVTQVVCVIRRH